MALVSGNRSAQDRLWWYQSGSSARGSGLEDGPARGQRTHGRTSQSAREDPPSRGWEEEGSGDGSELARGSGGIVRAQRGSDEPDQMDDAFTDAAGQGALSAGTSHQENGAGRLVARAGQPKGQETRVNVYDYRSLASGKAIPYGIYDLVHNQGFVNVGIDHETAEFAVESIRRWWKHCGKGLYPQAQELLITADGGGSNGVRNKLWKKALQTLATEEQLTITVAHYPPATSKWNKIEHRLFSFISINWRAKPLTSLETVIELISHTTTEEGLHVTAIKDSQTYPTGLTVSDAELKALNIVRDAFHGEWNYTIKPQDTTSP